MLSKTEVYSASAGAALVPRTLRHSFAHIPGCAISGGSATHTSSSTYACKCALRTSIRRAVRAPRLR
eukprot:12120990-Alexandrium_andersonii.AAC.1